MVASYFPARRLLLYSLQEAVMADDLKQTGKQDDERINVEQDHELSYWSGKLGVSRDKLREAVAKVGPMRKAVERHLRG
jgi:hypothetical protein